MTTSELPPPEIPTKPLDDETLVRFLDDAMKAARDALSQFEPPSVQHEITRPNESGFATEDLQAPQYGRLIFREAENVCRLPESQVLFNYLWESGSLRMSITRGDGTPAQRPAWDRAIWGQVIHGALHWLIFGAALEDLVLTGKYRRWHLDPVVRATACAGIAQQLVRGHRTLTAECLVDATLPTTEEIDLEPGVVLKQLTTAEQCIHLTKFSPLYSEDDIIAPFHKTRIRITKTVSDLSIGAGEPAIADAIDRVKWAICVGSDRGAVFHEGPVIVRGPDGFRGATLRRQENRLGSKTIPQTANLSLEELTRAEEALRGLSKVENNAASQRLGKAVWLFGRACTASLTRDVLLDAVVGLDSLLAPGTGESMYRVSLHGTALLAPEDPGETFSTLKEMYGLRSGAAHSGGSSNDRYEALAPTARRYLASVAYAIVRLLNAGEIVLESKELIPHGVEGWIRKTLFCNASSSLGDARSSAR